VVKLPTHSLVCPVGHKQLPVLDRRNVAMGIENDPNYKPLLVVKATAGEATKAIKGLDLQFPEGAGKMSVVYKGFLEFYAVCDLAPPREVPIARCLVFDSFEEADRFGNDK